jgi:capsular exopolysaccharide synthesis family protein
MKRLRKDSYLLTMQEPSSIITEAYRTIRTFLKYGNADADHSVLLFSSPLAGEGKTTAVSNLGFLLAQDGKRTLLVDGDLRRPNLHHIFRVANRVGLSSCLSGYSAADDAIARTEVDNLFLMPAGPIQPNPSELLGSPRMAGLIAHAKSKYDVVLIDAPPLLLVSDAAILAQAVDGIVMVIRAYRTRREDIVKAQKLLEPFRAKVAGFIMNDKREGQ